MSGCKPVPNEKGFVLVLALLITAILFLMAVTLSYNMASYLRIFASTKGKTQTYYTDIAATEQLRDYLWNSEPNYPEGCDPGNRWCGLLRTNSNIYSDITGSVTSAPLFGGAAYGIYFKDNEDGDDTFASDSDQLVLASVVAEDPNTHEKTAIEAMLIYKTPGYSAQAGMGASKGNSAKGTGPGTTAVSQTIGG